MASLGATFGRGAATNAQWDLVNSDCIVIMGSNMAENHPVAFRFVLEAKERGSTVIHVDPRFTRTSALADIYAPIRCGSDIAFLGGIIHHVLERDLWFKEYALHYTNLATIINDGFRDAEQADGLFSGWDEKTHTYKMDTWQYAGEETQDALEKMHVRTGSSYSEKLKRNAKGPPQTDPTLQHPSCVYQILKRHYARYTPEMVERVTGCPKDVFLAVADAVARNSGRERTGAWCYAVGWTHHSTGVQIIRACGIIQGLLGNIGRPGGGILALRGHCSIQGSTDVPTLFEMLPGYLPHPHSLPDNATLSKYLEAEIAERGYWHKFPHFMISLLRAWYGEHASPENEWGFSGSRKSCPTIRNCR